MNKYQQVKRLHSDEFLIPRYMMGTCEIGYETVMKRLGRVFVVKGLESSMGREIWLIGNADEYAIWELKQRKDKEFSMRNLFKEVLCGYASLCTSRRGYWRYEENFGRGFSNKCGSWSDDREAGDYRII